MLASITPLGERSRNSRWTLTLGWFLLGATAAGTALGALLGTAGHLLLPVSVSTPARLAALAVATLAAAWLDLRRPRVPGPRRQVDERWLQRYRGWVYGLGYGAQLGVAVATVVSSAATYAALVAAFLSANTARGLAIVGVYGAIRGLTPLAAAHVRTPQRLFAFHAAFTRSRGPVARAAALATLVVCAACIAGAVG